MAAYEYQEFPKVKYHPKHKPRTVQNTDEEKALGRGWVNSPNDFPKPSKVIKTLRDDVKPRWEEWKWLVAAIAGILGIVVAVITVIKFLR